MKDVHASDVLSGSCSCFRTLCTASAYGGMVKSSIDEALKFRRAQSAERRKDALCALIGIVITNDNAPPILLFPHDPTEENLRSWLLRMKSNEIAREPPDPQMPWSGHTEVSLYAVCCDLQEWIAGGALCEAVWDFVCLLCHRLLMLLVASFQTCCMDQSMPIK